jgi:putative peptide zinc metalloprotease protein
MSESLLSPQWFRVSALHPQLRPQVQVHRQPSRGQNWYVLHNVATGRFHRVHARAYELVGRLDGHLSLDQVWRSLVEQLGDDAPTQDEALGVLAQLADGDLLQAEELPDLRRFIAQSRRRARVEQRARVNPFSFRVRLFDPAPWLRRAGPWARAVFSWPVAWLWLVLVASGAWLAWTHQPELSGHMAQALGQPRMLLLMWLVYPVMKALHEAGHALALRRYGCQSHEVGVTFLLLMPLLHVDATDALRLGDRWQRATIVAAGMVVELALAAMAAWVWSEVAPGLVRDVALLVMVLGGASTLLFNGNPLMRYDGYHLLCDVMDLPNLGARSTRHWRQRLQAWLGRSVGRTPRPAVGVAMDARERWALWAYAPAAWWWRLVVSAMVMQWVAHWSPWLSWAVGLWMAWSLLVQPVTGWIRESVEVPELGAARERARWMLIGLMTAMVATVMWWPWSPSLNAQGLVWMPQEATLRAPHPARVEALLVRDGQPVAAGQPLMRLGSQELEAEAAVLKARIAALEAERSAAWGREPVRVRQAQEALQRDIATLQDLTQRLTVKAPQAGLVVLQGGGDGLGSDIQQGDLLAHVLPTGGARVLAVIPEDDVGLWREALRASGGQGARPEVMVSDERGEVRQARLVRQAPAALERLPTVALGATQGGPVQTDPADPDGLKPLRPVFVIELDVPDRGLARVGARAQVKLSLPAQSLADQLVFRFRQLLLRQFAQLA